MDSTDYAERSDRTVVNVAHPYARPVPLLAIVLLALAIHGPLLLMQLPAGSYDANFHMFFASHYAQHWFDPWNVKWFAGFSQTTYPPLTHQWIALFSYVVGLKMAYMLVQLIAILLLPVGVYRFARIWVSDREASYAAIGSIFLGALAGLVYQAGQLATVASVALSTAAPAQSSYISPHPVAACGAVDASPCRALPARPWLRQP